MYFISTNWILLLFISGFDHLVQCDLHEGDADTNPPDGNPVAVAIQPNRNVDNFANAQPYIPTSWTEWSNEGACEGRCDTGYILQRRHCVFSTALPIDILPLQPQCVGNGVRIKECQLVSCFALEHPDLEPEQYTTYFLEKAISVVNSYKALTTQRKKITKVLQKKGVSPENFMSGINFHLTQLRKKMNKKVIKKLRKQLGNKIKFAKITVAVSNSQINILNDLSSAVIETSSSVMQVVSSGKKQITGEFTKMEETISNIIHAAEDVIDDILSETDEPFSENVLQKICKFLEWKGTFINTTLSAISDVNLDKKAKKKVVDEVAKCLNETIDDTTKTEVEVNKKQACNRYMFNEFVNTFNALAKIYDKLNAFWFSHVEPQPWVIDGERNIPKDDLDTLIRFTAFGQLKKKIADLLNCIQLFLYKDTPLIDVKALEEALPYIKEEVVQDVAAGFTDLEKEISDLIKAFGEWREACTNDSSMLFIWSKLSAILDKLSKFEKEFMELPEGKEMEDTEKRSIKAQQLCDWCNCIKKELETLKRIKASFEFDIESLTPSKRAKAILALNKLMKAVVDALKLVSDKKESDDIESEPNERQGIKEAVKEIKENGAKDEDK